MRCIPHIFVTLCNCSFNTGIFPDSCKIARVTIIPKGGDLRNMDNLRPISILPLLGKVLEKHAKNEIVDYFEENGLFHMYQFGFRKNRCTFDAIFQVIDNVTRWRNAGGGGGTVA